MDVTVKPVIDKVVSLSDFVLEHDPVSQDRGGGGVGVDVAGGDVDELMDAGVYMHECLHISESHFPLLHPQSILDLPSLDDECDFFFL